jgi:hypothetical protein
MEMPHPLPPVNPLLVLLQQQQQQKQQKQFVPMPAPLVETRPAPPSFPEPPGQADFMANILAENQRLRQENSTLSGQVHECLALSNTNLVQVAQLHLKLQQVSESFEIAQHRLVDQTNQARHLLSPFPTLISK